MATDRYIRGPCRSLSLLTLDLTIKHVLSRATRSFRGTIESIAARFDPFSRLCVTNRVFKFSRPRDTPNYTGRIATTGMRILPSCSRSHRGKNREKIGKKSGKIGRKGRNSGVYSGCEVPGGILSGMEGRFAGGNSMNANNGVDMAWIWRGYRVVCRYREGYIKVTYTIGGWVRHGWFAGRVRVRESYIYREKGNLDSALQSTQPPRLQWCAFGSLYTARYSFFAASRPW